ncbi:MAG: hypothetical protein ACKVP2_12005 [Burkholderiales bacterium]
MNATLLRAHLPDRSSDGTHNVPFLTFFEDARRPAVMHAAHVPRFSLSTTTLAVNDNEGASLGPIRVLRQLNGEKSTSSLQSNRWGATKKAGLKKFGGKFGHKRIEPISGVQQR